MNNPTNHNNTKVLSDGKSTAPSQAILNTEKTLNNLYNIVLTTPVSDKKDISLFLEKQGIRPDDIEQILSFPNKDEVFLLLKQLKLHPDILLDYVLSEPSLHTTVLQHLDYFCVDEALACIMEKRLADGTITKSWIRGFFRGLLENSRAYYVAHFLPYAPHETFDALLAVELLDRGYVNNIFLNHHVFSTNAIRSVLYFIASEFPEYHHNMVDFFIKNPWEIAFKSERLFDFLDAENQEKLLKHFANRNLQGVLTTYQSSFTKISPTRFEEIISKK